MNVECPNCGFINLCSKPDLLSILDCLSCQTILVAIGREETVHIRRFDDFSESTKQRLIEHQRGQVLDSLDIVEIVMEFDDDEGGNEASAAIVRH